MGINMARRAQFVWFLLPVWAKAAILTGVSTVLGLIDGLPLQAVFVLSLMTLAFALVFVLIVNEWIRQRNEADDEVQLAKPCPKVTVVFNEKYTGHFVPQPGRPNQFCIENVGDEAAVNVRVHDVRLTNRAIHFATVPESLKPAMGGFHRIGLDADVHGEAELESDHNDLADVLVMEHLFHKGQDNELRWPLIISYCDPSGRWFQTRGQFVSHRIHRRVWFEFERVCYVREAANG